MPAKKAAKMPAKMPAKKAPTPVRTDNTASTNVADLKRTVAAQNDLIAEMETQLAWYKRQAKKWKGLRR